MIFKTYLAPNAGQKQLHYHAKITEKFMVLQGDLQLQIASNTQKISAGNSISVPPKTKHCFFNSTAKQVVFKVEIQAPNQMLEGLQIIYGLTNAGKTTKKGIPKNILHTAIALAKMDTYAANIPYRLQKTGIAILALVGKKLGIEKKLLKNYAH